MITLLLTLFLLAAMLSWNRAEEIERRFSKKLPICDFIPQLDNLRSDTDIVKLTDNLVYLDREEIPETIDQAILYSILDRGPKRAQAYWFIRIRTVGEPYVERYQVETFGTDCVFRVELDLGFKCSRPLTWYLREVFLDMERQGLTSIHRKNHFVSEESELGTFRYCILRRYATGIEQLSTTELWALRIRHILEGLAGLREEWYTDKDTNVEVERIPLSLSEESSGIRIQRVFRNGEEQTLHTEE
jgi:KUP system potassium uptake protein